jgi:hypothetical protein
LEGKWEPTPEHLAIYAEHCAGRSQRRIARKFECSQYRIFETVQKVDRWFSDQYSGRIREIKANHTQRLEYIFREAMAAWRRSQEDTVSESDTVGGKDGGKTVTTRKGQVGAAAFLSEARAAIKEIREIWGANAPLQIEASGEVRVAGRPVSECRSELLERAQRIAEAMRN